MKTLYLIKKNPLELAIKGGSGSPKIRRNIADDQEVIAPDGYAYAVDVAEPDYDSDQKKIVRKIKKDGDDYFYGWEKLSLTDEEKATPIPTEVTNFQIKRALNQTGDRQAVEALIKGSNDQDTIDGWQHASVFKKDNVLFKGAVAYLGWDQKKIDDLFSLASTFE